MGRRARRPESRAPRRRPRAAATARERVSPRRRPRRPVDHAQSGTRARRPVVELAEGAIVWANAIIAASLTMAAIVPRLKPPRRPFAVNAVAQRGHSGARWVAYRSTKPAQLGHGPSASKLAHRAASVSRSGARDSVCLKASANAWWTARSAAAILIAMGFLPVGVCSRQPDICREDTPCFNPPALTPSADRERTLASSGRDKQKLAHTLLPD